MANKIIAGILFAIVTVAICNAALSFAPRPADVERMQQTTEYKNAEQAQLIKWETK
jgi:hypothetical protein